MSLPDEDWPAAFFEIRLLVRKYKGGVKDLHILRCMQDHLASIEAHFRTDLALMWWETASICAGHLYGRDSDGEQSDSTRRSFLEAIDSLEEELTQTSLHTGSSPGRLPRSKDV